MQLQVLTENFIQVPGLPQKTRENDQDDNDDRSKACGFSYVQPYCITLEVILGQSREHLNPEQRTSPCLILLQIGIKCFKCPESDATVKPQPKG